MASRKEQKEAARAARLAREQELAARAGRTRRMQILGGVIAVAIAVIVVVVVISTGGANKNAATGLKKGSSAVQTYDAVNSLIGGIPQSGNVLGQPSAKVTMVYFGDLQCPICRDFTLNSFPQFVKDYVRTGKVKVHYKSACTASCNNQSYGSEAAAMSVFDTQQVAAYAAGEQDKFWYFAELFYHEQGTEGTPYVNSTFLNGLAKQIPGLNISKWTADRKDPTLLSEVNADESLSEKDAPDGTPTLIMEGPKGEVTVQEPADSFPQYSNLVTAYNTVT